VRRPLNPEVVLRWASLGIGLFLVVRPDLILKSAQALTPLAQTLFPNSPWGQVIVVLGATPLPMQGGVLFLITAWGLGKGSRWARWTGLAACLCLLPGLPWFTLLGTVGAVLIFTIPIKASLQAMPPAPPEAVNDYWTAARNSKAQKILLFLSETLLILGLRAGIRLAHRIRLPEWKLDWIWWPWAFALALGNTAIHELGHAFMAFAEFA